MLTGNLAGNALFMLTLLVLGRRLGSESFGLLSSMLAAMMLIATVSDFGLATTLIKYYRERVTTSPASAEALLRWAFGLRLAIVAAAAGLPALLAGPICRLWLGADDALTVGLFRLACLGAAGTSLWMLSQTILQARGDFGRYAWQTFLNHALRFALVLALLAAGWLAIGSAMAVLALVPLAGVVMARAWPQRSALANVGPTHDDVRTMFHFSKWIFVSTVICSVIMQLDLLMLAALAGKHETGQFAFAARPAQALLLLSGSVSTVLLPRLSATRSRAAMQRVFRTMLRLAPLGALAGVLALLAVHLAWTWIGGVEYARAVWVFHLLAISYMLTLVVNPLSYFCLAFGRPHWLAAMNAVQLVISAGLNALLIPRLGALGSGLAALGVFGFSVLAVGLMLRRLYAEAEE